MNGPGSFVLTIQDYTFDPQHLEVPPGATIVVLNHDHFAHTVTSAAAAGTYVYGEVNGVGFDTGPFRGTRTVTIPPAAPVGTVVPYFCAEYRDAMLDAPDITIVTPPAE